MTDALRLLRIADHHISRADFEGASDVLALLRIVTAAMRPTGAGKFADSVLDAVRQLSPLDGAAVALRMAADSINTNDEVSVGVREFADMYALVVGSMARGSVAALVDRIVRPQKGESRGDCCRGGDIH
jgi:hypothetical protein